MNNDVKLSIRVLLPAIVWGIAYVVSSLWDTIIYGGHDKMLEKGLIDNYSMIASFVVVSFIAFLSPVLLLIHGGICRLNKRKKFNVKYFAITIFLIITLLEMLTMGSGNVFTCFRLLGYINLFLTILLPLLIYVCGLNYTREALTSEFERPFLILWIIICFTLVTGCLSYYVLMVIDEKLYNKVFTICSIPIMNYGLFGLMWIVKSKRLKWVMGFLMLILTFLALYVFTVYGLRYTPL